LNPYTNLETAIKNQIQEHTNTTPLSEQINTIIHDSTTLKENIIAQATHHYIDNNITITAIILLLTLSIITSILLTNKITN